MGHLRVNLLDTIKHMDDMLQTMQHLHKVMDTNNYGDHQTFIKVPFTFIYGRTSSFDYEEANETSHVEFTTLQRQNKLINSLNIPHNEHVHYWLVRFPWDLIWWNLNMPFNSKQIEVIEFICLILISGYLQIQNMPKLMT